mgnify:CR=1 FL=1
MRESAPFPAWEKKLNPLACTPCSPSYLASYVEHLQKLAVRNHTFSFLCIDIDYKLTLYILFLVCVSQLFHPTHHLIKNWVKLCSVYLIKWLQLVSTVYDFPWIYGLHGSGHTVHFQTKSTYTINIDSWLPATACLPVTSKPSAHTQST